MQSYLGVINDVGDANQNLIQTYTVTKVDHRHGNHRTVLGTGTVPPNNQGIATPFYNQGNDGNNPAKDGVATEGELDRYTTQTIKNLGGGYFSFAGQRDDGFYADINAVFDLLQLRSPGKDSQGGFNIHVMALVIPVSELGGDQQMVGVYATTSRRQIQILRDETDRSVRGETVARSCTAAGCRSPGKATRSSTRAWLLSLTRIATAVPVPTLTTSCSANTR